MLRDYISRAEAEELAVLAALVFRLDEIAEKWAGLGRGKEQVKWLRSARTFGQKAIDAAMDSLSNEQQEKVLKATMGLHYCPLCLTLNSKMGVAK